MQHVFILGRQPELGTAELESLYGPEAIIPLGKQAVVIDLGDTTVNFQRLGASTRFCKLITYIPTTDWQKINNYLVDSVAELAGNLPEGKIRLGLSLFGKGISPRTINATGLALKKVVKSAGRSVRVVPNTTPELNTAQVLHNQLTGPTGLELVLIQDGARTALAQTIAVQDIEAYAARDQKRPKRDARVGMLPPKLAQIIINLATGQIVDSYDADSTPTILDPFCGTGVVLQEAMLMGYKVYGTDLEPRMVEYSQINLDWLLSHPRYNLQPITYNLEIGDATKHHWQPFDIIACETYLGRPLSNIPSAEKLSEIVSDCDTIHRKFLKNLASQTKPGFRACIAVPAWKTSSGFRHLRTLDSLEELGYNRLRFVHVSNQSLIYHRPDQVVGRELVVLERK